MIVLKNKRISKVYEVYILTKINSQKEKNKNQEYSLKYNINNFYFVPYKHSKTQCVNAEDNILIDDDINNLNNWNLHGGK